MTVLIQIQNANIYIDQQEAKRSEQSLHILRSPTNKCPSASSTINVIPVQGSSLGTISALATYGICSQTGNPPKVVYAQVYPFNLLPGGPGSTSVPFPSPAPQQAANPSSGLYTWSALPYVDSSTSPGAQNFFVLWSSVSGETPTTSDAVVQFSGVPSGGSTCSYGSSSGGPLTAARELTGTHHLHIVILDGANVGEHTATAVAALRWNATIRGTHYLLLGTDAGASLAIKGPHGSVASKSVTFDPFVAIFPGAIFGATTDVVVILG